MKFDFNKAIDDLNRRAVIAGLKVGFIAGVVIMALQGAGIYFFYLRHHLK